MDDNKLESKLHLSKLMGLIGAGASLFIPFIGIAFLCVGVYQSYKMETLEIKHSFYFNLIALIASIFIFIVTIITTY